MVIWKPRDPTVWHLLMANSFLPFPCSPSVSYCFNVDVNYTVDEFSKIQNFKFLLKFPLKSILGLGCSRERVTARRSWWAASQKVHMLSCRLLSSSLVLLLPSLSGPSFPSSPASSPPPYLSLFPLPFNSSRDATSVIWEHFQNLPQFTSLNKRTFSLSAF